jgi:hypothetical protein
MFGNYKNCYEMAKILLMRLVTNSLVVMGVRMGVQEGALAPFQPMTGQQ